MSFEMNSEVVLACYQLVVLRLKVISESYNYMLAEREEKREND